MTTLARVAGLAAVAASVVALLSPAPARACGGTFCDVVRGIPVDQTGETILFVRDRDQVEAHVQIAYDGDPERFAWIVPVTSLPTFSVGSQELFDDIGVATSPVYTTTVDFEECEDDSGSNPGGGGGGGGGCGGGFGGLGWGSDGADSPYGSFDQDEDIWFHELVGAFEVAVLEVDSVDELYTWLGENDYTQDENARPILEEYLQEGFLFAALKLRPGAGLDELHPIVMRYAGTQPCIPIRLTRIAAADDMPIQVYFLGEYRMAPLDYAHVVLNEARIDWRTGGRNYRDEVALAVDVEGADGRAFVTEYAGPSDVVPVDTLFDADWNADAFRRLSVEDAVQELYDQALYGCEDDWCVSMHPLVEPLIERFFPLPDGVSVDEYFICPTCYEGELDLEQWDPQGFADAIESQVIEPSRHAVELLQRWPYLTRLYTRISPHEMTEDPLFRAVEDLPTVDNVHEAEVLIRCDGIDVIDLPDGRQLGLVQGEPYPSFGSMPAAERVEQIGPAGAPVVEVDNREVIDEHLVGHNELALERAGASIEAIDPQWGGGVEDDGCGCRFRGRSLTGAFWLGVIFVYSYGSRRRRPT